jgi:hypothetical protein
MERARRSSGWLPVNARTLNELICHPQSDRLVVDRGRRVFAELPDYGELDGI